MLLGAVVRVSLVSVHPRISELHFADNPVPAADVPVVSDALMKAI